MAELREKSGPLALLAGVCSFAGFEALAFYLLRFLTSFLGEANQSDNTVVDNWLKTLAFLVLHLALVIAAVLVLSNRLPRRYRSQVLGWFYVSLLTGFVLLIPLFS